MQLEGLILFLFIIVSIPIMIITSNHNIFFVLIGLAITFFSLLNLNDIFQIRQAEEEEEDTDDLEGMINIDSRRFGMGIEFAKELIIILFFLYCAMYVRAEIFKILIALSIAYRVLDISSYLRKHERIIDHFNSIWTVRAITLLVNLANLAIILPVAYNKFIHFIF